MVYSGNKFNKNAPDNTEAEELKNFLFVSLISVENDMLTEEVKQEILSRYSEDKYNWEYILEPIEDSTLRNNLIEVFNF